MCLLWLINNLSCLSTDLDIRSLALILSGCRNAESERMRSISWLLVSSPLSVSIKFTVGFTALTKSCTLVRLPFCSGQYIIINVILWRSKIMIELRWQETVHLALFSPPTPRTSQFQSVCIMFPRAYYIISLSLSNLPCSINITNFELSNSNHQNTKKVWHCKGVSQNGLEFRIDWRKSLKNNNQGAAW